MLTDGIDLLDGSSITNMTVASGTSLPSSPTPNDGELFYLTSGNIGLHVYDSSTPGWVRMTTASGTAGGAATNASQDLLRVRLNTTFTPTASVSTLCPFSVVENDTQSAYNSSTYTYTPNKAGWYLFNMIMTPTVSPSLAEAAYVNVHVYKNGGEALRCAETMATNITNSSQLTGCVYANGVSDAFTFFVTANNNGSAFTFTNNDHTTRAEVIFIQANIGT